MYECSRVSAVRVRVRLCICVVLKTTEICDEWNEFGELRDNLGGQ